MAILSYDQTMHVDTFASLPMNASAGTIAFADDTSRHYMFSTGVWYLITNPNDKTSVRFVDNGVPQNGTPLSGDIIVFSDSVTTVSGNAVFPMTTNHLTTGTAYCSTILSRSIQLGFTDSAGLYAVGVPTVAGTFKTITVPVTKQSTTGVTVLGIAVLAALTMPAAPDGVNVKLYAVGIAT